MSEDDKKNKDDIIGEETVVEETADEIETVEAEIIDDVVDDEAVDAVEQAADIIEPVASQNRGFGSLVIAALLGGVATVALVVGLGYYAIISNNLGGLSKLINGGDAAAAAEERYTDVSTRILSLEGVLIELQEAEPVAVDLSPIADKIAALEGLLAEQAEQNATLKNQLSNIATVSDGNGNVDGGVIVALQDAMKSQNDVIEQIQSQILALNDEVAEAANVSQAAISTAIEAAADKNKVVAGDGNVMASALAVAAMERALQDEAPFEVELNALKAFASESAALTELSKYADQGLANEVTLLEQFNDLLDAALVADLKGEGKSILDRFIGNAKSVISIRQTGNVEGTNAEAVLARMEVAILNKNLNAAIAEGESLEGPAKQVFAKWMTTAKNRIAAQDFMRQVSADILTSLKR